MKHIAATPVNIFIVMLQLLMIITMSSNFTSASTSVVGLGDIYYKDDDQEHGFEIYNNDVNEDEEVGFGLIRGSGRMLATSQKKITCNKYPRVCRIAGSPGRDCCKKKCVNVNKDRVNCGKCGKKCKYSEICCKGKCVNVLRDKRNCGGCGNKCSKGDTCRYGMCRYA